MGRPLARHGLTPPEAGVHLAFMAGNGDGAARGNRTLDLSLTKGVLYH